MKEERISTLANKLICPTNLCLHSLSQQVYEPKVRPATVVVRLFQRLRRQLRREGGPLRRALEAVLRVGVQVRQ